MTCGIWKRSLPPSGFIILPQPGKPWGCPRLCGPLAPRRLWWASGMRGRGRAAAERGLCLLVLMSWLMVRLRTCKPTPLVNFGCTRFGLAFCCLPLPRLCSRSSRSRLLRCPRSARLQKGNVPLPCFTCSIFSRVGLGSALLGRCAHHRLGRTEKRKQRRPGQPGSFPRTPCAQAPPPPCAASSSPQPAGARWHLPEKCPTRKTGGLALRTSPLCHKRPGATLSPPGASSPPVAEGRCEGGCGESRGWGRAGDEGRRKVVVCCLFFFFSP